jgi:hypothetical protein
MTDLPTLAAKMGYTPRLESAGYQVTRVMLDRPCGGSSLFNPYANDAQSLAVLLWVITNCKPENTNEIRAAIVDAAGRME